jgi:molybdate transport system substrate-binding protein
VTRIALLVLVASVAGCGSSSSGGSAGTTPAAKARTLTVFAASSLSSAFAAEGKAFEAAHSGVHVTFSFAGSQALVAQVKQGAPADVLATADTSSMAAAGLTGPRVFARNRLSIITAPQNPKHVTTLADLARPGLRVVLAGPTVPVGKAALKALGAAGVTAHPVSLEQDVKGVVTKVRLGEADAGIAYVTDVSAAKGTVRGTALPGVSNSYPVAVVKQSVDAQTFSDFLLSPTGQSVLASFGFLPPT